MPHLLIHHKVQDFDNWKTAYDAHLGVREQAGLRGAADRNDVVILFSAQDLERARAFSRSDDLRNAMQQAGVVGMPELIELE